MGTLAATVLDRLGPRLMAVSGTVSVTVVGSVVDNVVSDAIGDIDIIVIGERLTPSYFYACNEAARVDAGDLGFPGFKLRINTTLGPLKLSTSSTVVLHLMLYDLEGHRDHVLSSPFTCLDWERSPYFVGRSLSSIYPVLRLQVSDFTSARRGLHDYLADLDRGTIGFRRYVTAGTQMVQENQWCLLDSRHQAEFAYHVMRNLAVNYLKFVSSANRRFSDAEFDQLWHMHLGACSEHLETFRRLREAKRAGTIAGMTGVLQSAREFVSAFQASLASEWDGMPRITLIRHASTCMNDGTFLGQRRDPPVYDSACIMPLEEPPGALFCSPARRAVETCSCLFPGRAFTRDARLAEIDYGAAEGLTMRQVSERFPEVAAAWERGEDPFFPDGENTTAVLARVQEFIRDAVSRGGVTTAVTHNVVMRSVAGSLYGIPQGAWHRLVVNHLSAIRLVARGGNVFPDCERGTKAGLIDGLVGWNSTRPRGVA